MSTEWTPSTPKFRVGEITGEGNPGSGVAVNAADDRLVAGAPNYNDGRVYTYERSGSDWVEDVSARLDPTDADAGQDFGATVALSTDGLVLAVGAPAFGSAPQGRVYIYDWGGTSWTYRNHIVGTNTYNANDPFFGDVVSLSGDGEVLVVGCNNGDHSVVYTYDRNLATWDLRTPVLEPTGLALNFGYGVSISQDATTLANWCYADRPGTAESIEVFEDVAGVWVKTHHIPLPEDSYCNGGVAISPNKLSIAYVGQWDATDFGYWIGLLDYDGDNWGFNADQTEFLLVDMDSAYFRNALAWLTDTQMYAGVSYGIWLDTLPAYDYVGYVHSLSLAEAVVETETLLTGAIQRVGTSALSGDLVPIQPPIFGPNIEHYWNSPTNDGAPAFWWLQTGTISADGLSCCSADTYNGWLWILRRDSLDSGRWYTDTILNRAWTDDFSGIFTDDPDEWGYWAGFGGQDYGSVAMSGDGTVVVSSMVDAEEPVDPDIWPQFVGVIEYGAVATYRKDPATGEWVNKGWIQSNDTLSSNNVFGYSCALSTDGMIMWVGTWTNGGTGATVFDWDEVLDNWVQRGSSWTAGGTSSINPAWADPSENNFGHCSGDGSTFCFRVYEGEGSAQFMTIIVEWNGAAVVQKGNGIYAVEWGEYAHPVALSMGGDATGDTVYMNLVNGSNSEANIVAYEWADPVWVARTKPLVGPFYTYAYGYNPRLLGVADGETVVIIGEYLDDIPRSNELWGVADKRFDTPAGDDSTEDYLTTYGLVADGSCYTKIGSIEDAQIVQVGEYCVDWAQPPSTPPVPVPPTLPNPPGGGGSTEFECDESGARVIPVGVSVTDSEQFEQYVRDNIEALSEPCP